MDPHDLFMHRCIELAALGQGRVAPNPMVGAVLVYEGNIIGEGFHEEFGGPHAEVNCIQSVPASQQQHINSSTLYVSLEPCAHFGKTPPCADLIIRRKIPRVVIGCRDPFSAVNGKGIEKLSDAGIEVVQNVLEKECRQLNAAFFSFHTAHRPYIILKWAETANGMIASDSGQRLLISNEYSNRLVHKWRSEVMSIMVGRKTALADDPALNTRKWPGKSPIRIVIDPELSLPPQIHLFDRSVSTIVFNLHKHSIIDLKEDWKDNDIHFYQLTNDVSFPLQITQVLYQAGIHSVLIEGGAMLLQSFIDNELWDEARIITNEQLTIGQGLPAPVIKNSVTKNEFRMGTDLIKFQSHLP